MTGTNPRKKPYLKALIVSLILCAVSVVCAIFPVRLLGELPSFIEMDGFVAATLGQLKKAQIDLPWWMLAPGTLLIMLPVYRMCKTRRFFVGFLCFFPLILFQVAVWIASICTMHINKIPIATVLRILYNWVMSGAL